MNATASAPSAVLVPQAGAQIVPLSIRGGVLTIGRAFTVNPRAGFLLSSEEYSGSDGCRHHIESLYPNAPQGGPANAPWGLAQSCSLYVSAHAADVPAATRALREEFARQARTVAAGMRDAAEMLEKQADEVGDSVPLHRLHP